MEIPTDDREDPDAEQKQQCSGVYADCAAAGATPLTISHNANATSNTSIGNHTNQVMDEDQLPLPPNNPACCNGMITTRRSDATTPSHASATGIKRPRRSSHENSVLPTAKKIAPSP